MWRPYKLSSTADVKTPNENMIRIIGNRFLVVCSERDEGMTTGGIIR